MKKSFNNSSVFSIVLVLYNLLIIDVIYSQNKIQKMNNENFFVISDKEEINPKQIFQINPLQFELSNNDKMNIKSEQVDNSGFTHYRYQQSFKGIEIEGAESIVHSKDNKTISVNCKIISGLDFDTSVFINKEMAIEIARNYINAQSYMWEDSLEEMRLKTVNTNSTYYPTPIILITKIIDSLGFSSNNLALAYKIIIYTKQPFDCIAIYIDTKTGNVIKKYKQVFNAETGTACTLYNGSQQIQTTFLSGSGYKLFDDSRGNGILTVYHKGEIYGAPEIQIFDTDNNWQCTDIIPTSYYNDNISVVTSPHYAAEKTYDYFYTNFNRNSYDDNGGIMRQEINFGYGAQWYPSNIAYFGRREQASSDWYVSLDVVGHEWGHGYVANISGYPEGSTEIEYNALFESFSDIFGTMVEFYAEGDATGDWIVGEDFCSTGNCKRSLINPNEFNNPDTYLGNYWVPPGGWDISHINAGVCNYWFYLLSEGGSGTNDQSFNYLVTGIGKNKAANILYNTLFYLDNNSDYKDLQKWTIYVAGILYGDCSLEQIQTINAWNAVGLYSFDYKNYNISTNTDWLINTLPSPNGNSPILVIDKTLTIKYNKTLIIGQGVTIKFGINGEIVIQSGGKLIIDGALITSSCSVWKGITSEPGSTIELKNGATIENAKIGIYSDENSKLNITGSTLKDNETAIWLNLNTNNTNKIINTTFETTSNLYSNWGGGPEAFIRTTYSDNVTITGCTFKNSSSVSNVRRLGKGIQSYGSGITISGCETYSLYECQNQNRNTFEHLAIAIQSSANELKKVIIKYNDFINNTHGVYLSYCSNPIIIFNNFTIGKPGNTTFNMSDPANYVSLLDTYEEYNFALGLLLSFSTDYKVEENTFISNDSYNAKIGLGIISYDETHTKQIYRNTFTNLPYSTIFYCYLCSQYTSATSSLKVRCNTFSNSIYDIAATSQYGINQNQGSIDLPSGNIFSQNSSNIKNIYDNVTYYYYNPSGTNENPTNVTSQIYKYSASNNTQTWNQYCKSHFSVSKPPVEDVKQTFEEYTDHSMQISNDYTTSVDAGNTDWFLKKITQNHNPSSMKKKLLEASPWLSDTVMVSLIGKDNYFAATDLTEVLVSNPQSATSSAVQTSLDSMTTPLPYTLRMQINSLDTVLSPKTAMEAQLASLLNEREYYANEIINYYLSDTLPGAKDSLIAFLASQNTLNYDYKLFSYYYTLSQTADARNLLTQLPSKYSLSGSELIYYNKFNDLYNILLNLKDNNLTTDSLNSTQIQTLRTLAIDTVSLPGNLAKRIICKIDSVPYNEWLRLPYETTTPANPLMGYVYESAECGSNPYTGDTLIIINEQSDTLLVTPAITDNYGFFQFNDSEIANLNPDEAVTIVTKSGYKLQPSEYKTITEWKNESPISFTLANSNLEWADLYSTVDSLYNGGTVLDLNGNLYVAGYTGTSANSEDMLLIKYNPAGERLWEQTYNGSANYYDRAVDIAVDNENNCYVLGNSAGTGTLSDIVLLKYSSDGNKLWEKRINGTGNLNDAAKSIAIDVSNNVYITGTIYSYTTGGDIVTIKYSKTGQLKWQKIYSTTSSEYATQIKLDNLGNVIVVGNSTDYITIKYNTNGIQQWVKTFNAGSNNVVSAITTDINNNIIVTGYCGSGNIYMTTVKYNTTGTQQWSSQYNISGVARDIATDNNANIYVVGYGNQNGIIIKYNTAGNELWATNYNSPINGIDALYACIIKNDHLYVTGFSNTIVGLPKSSEFLTIKYDFEGNQKWLETFNTSDMPERSNDIVVSENNNVYVTGVVYENSLYKMATLKYSQCPSTASLKSSIANPQIPVIARNEAISEDDELIQVINFQENKVIVYPNPYSESTRIELITKTDAQVSLEVYSMGGRLIENIFTGFSKEGKYNYTFSAKKLGYSAGTYVLKMTVGNEINSYWLVEMK